MTDEAIDELEDNLPSVPPETCPIIDTVLDGINSALRLCKPRGALRYRSAPETLEELASAVEFELEGLVDKLETIRKHNAALRELGYEWHKFAKEQAARIEASHE